MPLLPLLILLPMPAFAGWVVAENWRGDDRPLYACDADCVANRDRGKRIGRVAVGTPCDGPLDPPWMSRDRQWQYVGNGLAYCEEVLPAVAGKFVFDGDTLTCQPTHTTGEPEPMRIAALLSGLCLVGQVEAISPANAFDGAAFESDDRAGTGSGTGPSTTFTTSSLGDVVGCTVDDVNSNETEFRFQTTSGGDTDGTGVNAGWCAATDTVDLTSTDLELKFKFGDAVTYTDTIHNGETFAGGGAFIADNVNFTGTVAQLWWTYGGEYFIGKTTENQPTLAVPSVYGDVAATLPEWGIIQYDASECEVHYGESSDGISWDLLGTVSQCFTNVTYGYHAFSRNLQASVTYTLDNLDFDNTLDETLSGTPDPPPAPSATYAPAYSDPVAGVTVTGQTTVAIASEAALDTELASPVCGETLQIANGVTITGNKTLSASCAATEPFIVECLNDHQCVASGTWNMTGARIIVRYMDFDGGSVTVGGTNNKFIGNLFHGWSGSVGIRAGRNGSQAEIAYNEIYEPVAPTSNRYAVRTVDDGTHDFHYNGWIHHNFFRDLPDKPIPGSYSSGQTDAIEICETLGPSYAGLDAGWHVEYNLIKDHAQGSGTGAATIDYKCGGIVAVGNSFVNSPGRHDQRGASVASIFEANFNDSSSGGMVFHGPDHVIAGNESTAQIVLVAGNSTGVDCEDSASVGNTQGSTCRAHVVGNTAPLRVGRAYSGTCGNDPVYAADGTKIEVHTGSVTLECHENTSDTSAPYDDASTLGASYATAVQLSEAEVGPAAIANASAAYKSARDL